MLRSIKDDIRDTFNFGNMVSKIIIVNVAVYMIFALINAFAPAFYTSFSMWFKLPGAFPTFFYQPWSMLTHMFLHEGFWHVAWNMLMFYTFGNIIGDLLGDRIVLPTYLLGGIFGATLYLLASTFFPTYFFLSGQYALGASAGVLAVIFAAVATSPDYQIHLILLGPVRIKYIGLFILFFDIIGTRTMSNSGGHVMHLGGTAFGFLMVYLLREGFDISKFSFLPKKSNNGPRVTRPKRSLTVVSDNRDRKTKGEAAPKDNQDANQIDEILDKIRVSGMQSLTDQERQILNNASKNN